MLAGGAEGVGAGDSAEIGLRVDLDRPTLVRNCVASDDAKHVLAGRRVLAIRGKQVVRLGILASFPGVLWWRLGCLVGGRSAHLIVGEEVDVCARLSRNNPSAERCSNLLVAFSELRPVSHIQA